MVTLCLQYCYEDSMDMIAKLPTIAAIIYRNLYRGSVMLPWLHFVFTVMLPQLHFVFTVLLWRLNGYDSQAADHRRHYLP